MRIISGKHKHRIFQIPKSFNARPTTDFAKENLFNILNNNICFDNITALDLFSGTGSISFELISRGAKKVVSVEKRREHASFIKSIATKLGEQERIKVLTADALAFISKKNKENISFDFIFADPPYKLEDIPNIPNMIFDNGWLSDGAMLVLEHPQQYSFTENKYFIEHRVYGSVNFSFFIFNLQL